MMIIFWALTLFAALWYLGALVFAYHVFAFRYPRDISLPMLVIFVLITIPLSLMLISQLTLIYEGL